MHVKFKNKSEKTVVCIIRLSFLLLRKMVCYARSVKEKMKK